MISAPAQSFVPRKITRLMEFYFHCGVCPNPHRLVLCASHARQAMDVAQPYYGPADDGESCRLCDLAAMLIQKYQDDLPLLRGILSSPKALLGNALNPEVRRPV